CADCCPFQINPLPPRGFCQAVGAFQIDEGFHGNTRLDGLRFVTMYRWPGPIHEEKGELAKDIAGRVFFRFSLRRLKKSTNRSSLSFNSKSTWMHAKRALLCRE